MGMHNASILVNKTFAAASSGTQTFDYLPNFSLGFLGATVTLSHTNSFTGTGHTVTFWGLVRTAEGSLITTTASFVATLASATATSTTTNATVVTHIQTSASQPFSLEGFRVQVVVPNVTGATSTIGLKMLAQPVCEGGIS